MEQIADVERIEAESRKAIAKMEAKIKALVVEAECLSNVGRPGADVVETRETLGRRSATVPTFENDFCKIGPFTRTEVC